MQTLKMGADRNEILALLTAWTELLAQEQYDKAFQMFQAYIHDWAWTPEKLEAAIFTYGMPWYTREQVEKEFGSSDYKVTSLLQSPNKDQILKGIEIDFYDHPMTEEQAKIRCLTGTDYENIIGDVHYDAIPLNGDMSDLTAIFYIKRVDDQTCTLSLYDLHVM